jgi:hypothetical protein
MTIPQAGDGAGLLVEQARSQKAAAQTTIG